MTWRNPTKNLTQDIINEASLLSKAAMPQTIIDETEEDLNDLSNILSNFGAKVFRPKVHNLENFIVHLIGIQLEIILTMHEI